jgi:hypothetical protein
VVATIARCASRANPVPSAGFAKEFATVHVAFAITPSSNKRPSLLSLEETSPDSNQQATSLGFALVFLPRRRTSLKEGRR